MWGGTDDRQLNNATHSPDQHAEKQTNKLNGVWKGPGFQLLNGDWRVIKRGSRKGEREKEREMASAGTSGTPRENKRRQAAEEKKTRKERRENSEESKRKERESG